MAYFVQNCFDNLGLKSKNFRFRSEILNLNPECIVVAAYFVISEIQNRAK